MFRKTEITFTFEGIQGELTLVRNAMGSSMLFQDGIPLKKHGIFRKRYLVTTDRGQEYVELIRGLTFAYSATFRQFEIQLEEPLNGKEYIIGTLPLLTLFFGGGLLGAVFAILGVNVNYKFLQSEKRLSAQIIFSIAITALCYIAYLIFVFILVFLPSLLIAVV